jgi:hypothetical protein
MINDSLLIVLVEHPDSGLGVASTVATVPVVRRILDNDSTLEVFVDVGILVPIGPDNLGCTRNEFSELVSQPLDRLII